MLVAGRKENIEPVGEAEAAAREGVTSEGVGTMTAAE